MKPLKIVSYLRSLPHAFRCRNFRRRGFVTLYLMMSLIVLMGISSLVVDLGIAYQKRSYMQNAADASALAGAAYGVTNPNATVAQIQTAATDFATTNFGYTNGANNVSITALATPDAGGAGATGSVLVNITRPQPTLFARIFRMSVFKSDTPMTINTMNISSTATAIYVTDTTVSTGIAGNGAYGLVGAAVANLSLVGVLATTNRGDNRSSYYTSTNHANTGGTLFNNPSYAVLDGGSTIRRAEDDRLNDTPSSLVASEVGNMKKGDGYYFDLTIPDNTPVMLQLYDPGNANQNSDSRTATNKAWNETDNNNNNTVTPTGTTRSVVTKTRFQVWCDMGQPNDITKAKRVFNKLYADESTYSFDSPDNAAYGGWVNAVNIDPNAKDAGGNRLYPVGAKFYMNATTVDGTGKNGFNVRLNRTDTTTLKPKDTDTDFLAGNGTNVTTRGYLPINFGSNGTATLQLGWVPPGARQVTIKRFDVDVGTPSGGFAVTYTSTPTIDGTSTGTPQPALATTSNGAFGLGGVAANDITQTDTILLPATYPGGNWTLSYPAGTSDQSTWTMSYVGPVGATVATKIRLIK